MNIYQKWEYLVCRRAFENDMTAVDLSDLGNERWDLVQVVKVYESLHSPPHTEYYFKRPNLKY